MIAEKLGLVLFTSWSNRTTIFRF